MAVRVAPSIRKTRWVRVVRLWMFLPLFPRDGLRKNPICKNRVREPIFLVHRVRKIRESNFQTWIERERQRQRQRDRDRDRETETETERQRQRECERFL